MLHRMKLYTLSDDAYMRVHITDPTSQNLLEFLINRLQIKENNVNDSSAWLLFVIGLSTH